MENNKITHHLVLSSDVDDLLQDIDEVLLDFVQENSPPCARQDPNTSSLLARINEVIPYDAESPIKDKKTLQLQREISKLRKADFLDDPNLEENLNPTVVKSMEEKTVKPVTGVQTTPIKDLDSLAAVAELIEAAANEANKNFDPLFENYCEELLKDAVDEACSDTKISLVATLDENYFDPDRMFPSPKFKVQEPKYSVKANFSNREEFSSPETFKRDESSREKPSLKIDEPSNSSETQENNPNPRRKLKRPGPRSKTMIPELEETQLPEPEPLKVCERPVVDQPNPEVPKEVPDVKMDAIEPNTWETVSPFALYNEPVLPVTSTEASYPPLNPTNPFFCYTEPNTDSNTDEYLKEADSDQDNSNPFSLVIEREPSSDEVDEREPEENTQQTMEADKLLPDPSNQPSTSSIRRRSPRLNEPNLSKRTPSKKDDTSPPVEKKRTRLQPKKTPSSSAKKTTSGRFRSLSLLPKLDLNKVKKKVLNFSKPPTLVRNAILDSESELFPDEP